MFYYTNNEDEAYYLTSILNTTAPNEMMKDFQQKVCLVQGMYTKKYWMFIFPSMMLPVKHTTTSCSKQSLPCQSRTICKRQPSAAGAKRHTPG